MSEKNRSYVSHILIKLEDPVFEFFQTLMSFMGASCL